MSDDPFTVLLYYHYVDIEQPQQLCDWHIEVCNRLELKGRVRVSPEGINGTLGGTYSAISSYISEVETIESLKPDTIDWKLSGAVDRYNLESQQFKSLSVKCTKEVVSLDLTEKERQDLIEGDHLSPEEFHHQIDLHRKSHSDRLVLVDVRNVYETEIGRFDCESEDGSKIPVLDPVTRKFSDFKQFVDSNKDDLKDKKVLMYCTGGVRCERASAYMKLKGVDNVYQLKGGIHRYQEAFPDGGFFKGKNFVYDPRIAVPYKNNDEIVGRCRLCRELYDDYAPQVRCRKCRMLQLVCDDCRANNEEFLADGVLCPTCNAERNI